MQHHSDVEVQCDLLEKIVSSGGDGMLPEDVTGGVQLPYSRKRKFPYDLSLPESDTRVKNARRPGFKPEFYYETKSYKDPATGLRKIYPYYFTFTSFCKRRWIGRELLDVFEAEFRRYPRSYYEKQIAKGMVTVNSQKTSTSYRLKDNDIIWNTIHRHEFPVLDLPLKIVYEDENIIVLDKPSSIPVHPCGRYRHNTVTWILAQEMGRAGVHVIHRLDRLTSGLLLLGKNIKTARRLEEEIRDRCVSKEYFCLVEGKFPYEEITCNEPVEVISHKIGVCGVSATGKACSTVFRLLHYNNATKRSLVLCQPRTGRMHQIRVHLQFLGFPIVQDPLYNSEAFGPQKGKNGDYGDKSKEELIEELIRIHNKENYVAPSTQGDRVESVSDQEASCMYDQKIISLTTSINSFSRGCQTGKETGGMQFDPDFDSYEPTCLECNTKFRDPSPDECFMYLHAFQYKGSDWEYRTEVPCWAQEYKNSLNANVEEPV